jgi:hypothetical protein
MKAPTWCEKNTKPNSVAMKRVPNIRATSAEVSGTVESQSTPMTAPKVSALAGDIGTSRKAVMAIARRK